MMYRKLTHTFLTFHFIFILLISSRFNFLFSFLKDRTVTANANTVILIHFYSHYFKPNNLSLLYGARLHYNEIMHIYSTYSSFKKRNKRIYFIYYICNVRNMQQMTLHRAAKPTSSSHMLCSTYTFLPVGHSNRFSFRF